MKKVNKAYLISLYYDLRKKGVDHALAFAVCIDIAMKGVVEDEEKAP